MKTLSCFRPPSCASGTAATSLSYRGISILLLLMCSILLCVLWFPAHWRQQQLPSLLLRAAHFTVEEEDNVFEEDDPLSRRRIIIRDSLTILRSAGMYVCAKTEEVQEDLVVWRGASGQQQELLVPLCSSSSKEFEDLIIADQQQPRHYDDARFLQEEAAAAVEEETAWTYVINALCALVCVTVAAMAAGLTLGMLGLDPLLLLIKERAASDKTEQECAKKLLPVVQQHHRLLVTLLLMNAVANEALPLFLEALVPPAFAVLVSVTLVLFFGEIIPSAIFTGPNQLQIASSLVPLVRVVLFVLYPVAGPIAKLLDWLLHGHGGADDDDQPAHAASATYTRGELAALIRIQYEERLASKRNRKKRKSRIEKDFDHVGALDFTNTLRAAKHRAAHLDTMSQTTNSAASMAASEYQYQYQRDNTTDNRLSIHQDEVTMVEGALQMQTSVAMDVFTPMRKVFSIPSDMLLTEQNLVKIYAAGFTRVPVHEPGNRNNIVGVMMAKVLIVVNPNLARPVSTLPLRRPRCVSPAMPLVDLLNLLQSGGKGSRGGHLALVCARPSVGERAMDEGDSLPETAGLMGIITLEDVLEMLLQEQIYDEMDKRERNANRLAKMVVKRWKRFVERKKAGFLTTPMDAPTPAILPVVQQAIARVADGTAQETTALLEQSKTSDSNRGEDYFL